MAYLIGVALALATMGLSRVVGFDRDRALYPVMLIVIGSYYELFAAISGSGLVLLSETIAFAVFVALACLGFARWRWLVAIGLAGHGMFDAVHSHVINNPGVPTWWPPFCLSFDFVVALGVAVPLTSRGDLKARTPAVPPRASQSHSQSPHGNQ